MSIYENKKRKTKQLIQQVFLELMEEKTFESITIGDITSKARINRGTFYLHYVDKYDLLDQMEKDLFAELGRHIDALQSVYLATQTFETEQAQLAETLFSFIKLHAPKIRLFLSDHGKSGFHIRFKHAFMENVGANLERHASFYENLQVPMEYFLSFIASAFLGLVEQWISNNLDKTSQEMTQLYIEIIHFIQRKASYQINS